MRIFPRLHLPRFKPLARKLRQWRRHLSVARVTLLIEWLLFGGALLLLLTGSRAASLDGFGPRADFAALGVMLALFALLHFKIIKKRLVPAIERFFVPAPYDERRILFDLGQEARAAVNTDQLYKLIVNRIGTALETENVSIFVCDEATGHYICRISEPQPAGQPRSDDESESGPRLTLSREAFVVKRLTHLAIPLVIEMTDFEMWTKAFADASREVREARTLEREVLRQIKAHLLLQIKIKDQLVGILSLGPRRAGHEYSTTDKEMLMAVAAQLAFVIENSRLIERMVAEERLRRELALAAEVQRRLFPERPPASASLELSGFCQPARGVGGDYYDFLALGGERIGIAVADVAGKGISAALVMSNVQASLRSQTMAHHAPALAAGSLAELVSTMNQLLCSSTGGATYVTFFYAQFDEQTKQLTYVNAGHNPPFLLRTNGAPRLSVALPESSAMASPRNGHTPPPYLQLSTGGLAVGMFEHGHYEQETIQLHSGDLLVAYTDGVTEALDAAGEEFGEARLQDAIAAVAHLPADGVRDELVRTMQAWCAGAPQHDDLTFIVLKVSG
jgi:sigma-B regulation protein RsbU (phosphoserine phosphatase)